MPIIRRATLNDAPILAYNTVAMAFESCGERILNDTALNGVQNLLQKPDRGFCIVAEHNRVIIGSLIIVYEWSDWYNGEHWWIHSVFVTPQYRKQGVYRAMYAFIQDEMKRSPSARHLKLTVEKTNTVARRSYESLGMEEASVAVYRAK